MVSMVVALFTVKFGFTPPNTAVTVCVPGAMSPVGGVPYGAGSRRKVFSVPIRLPPVVKFTVPMVCGVLLLATVKVTVVAGCKPLIVCCAMVALKVTGSLYCWLLGVTVTVGVITYLFTVNIPGVAALLPLKFGPVAAGL